LRLIYCASGKKGRFLPAFSVHSPAMRLKSRQIRPRFPARLATIAQARQAAGRANRKAGTLRPMSKPLSSAISAAHDLIPQQWQSDVARQLLPGETPLAALELDLSQSLQFGAGLLLLTSSRLLVRAPEAGEWQYWPLDKHLALQHSDHAGVGCLSLHDDITRLGHWRFTLAHDIRAQRLQKLFRQHIDALVCGQPVANSEEGICPALQGAAAAGRRRMPDCASRHVTHRHRPGRCCACGSLPARTVAACWPASC
jgi:hypothetical protein